MKEKFDRYIHILLGVVAAVVMLAVAISMFRAYAQQVKYEKWIQTGEQIEVECRLAYSDKGDAAVVYEHKGADGAQYEGVYKLSELQDDAWDSLPESASDGAKILTVCMSESGESVPLIYRIRKTYYISLFSVAAALCAVGVLAVISGIVLGVWQNKLFRKYNIPQPNSEQKPNTGVAGSVFKTRKGFALAIVFMAVFLCLFAGVFVCLNNGWKTAAFVCVCLLAAVFIGLETVIECVRLRLLLKLKKLIAQAQCTPQESNSEQNTTSE